MEAVIGALKFFQLQNAHGAQDVYIWKQENKWGSNMFKFKPNRFKLEIRCSEGFTYSHLQCNFFCPNNSLEFIGYP